MNRLFAGIVLIFLSSSVFAAGEVEALGKCLGDSTTGRERKDLAKWIFLAMSSHPEIKPFVRASREDIEQSSKATAALFTRLITDACVNEVKSAIKTGGPVALQLGFQVLGQLAVQELMANQEVQGSIADFGRFIDQKRVNESLE